MLLYSIHVASEDYRSDVSVVGAQMHAIRKSQTSRALSRRVSLARTFCSAPLAFFGIVDKQDKSQQHSDGSPATFDSKSYFSHLPSVIQFKQHRALGRGVNLARTFSSSTSFSFPSIDKADESDQNSDGPPPLVESSSESGDLPALISDSSDSDEVRQLHPFVSTIELVLQHYTVAYVNKTTPSCKYIL